MKGKRHWTRISPDKRRRGHSIDCEGLRYGNRYGLLVFLVVSLIGAALYEDDGVKVSQVYYMQDETPVSLMIVCNTESLSGDSKSIDFSGMKEISIGEKVYYDGKGSCGHCQIMGWEKVGNQYVIISTLKSDEMMKMLKKA